MNLYVVFEWTFLTRGLRKIDSIWNNEEDAQKRIKEIDEVSQNACHEIEVYKLNNIG